MPNVDLEQSYDPAVLTAVAAALTAVAAVMSGWSVIAVHQGKRRQENTAATVEAARLQLENWERLVDGWEAQLKQCRANELKLTTELSHARTHIIALAKVITGEFPHDMAVELIKADEWEQYARSLGEPGGDPSPAE